MPNGVRKSKHAKAAKKKEDLESRPASQSPTPFAREAGHDARAAKRPAGDTHGRKPAASRPGSPERPKTKLDKANLQPNLYRYSRSNSPPWQFPATAPQSTVASPVNQTAFLYPGAASRPVSPDRTEGFLQEKKRAAAPHATGPPRGAPATARRGSVVPHTELPKRTHAVSKEQDEKGAKRWVTLREKAQPAETELPARGSPAHTEVQHRKVGAAQSRKQKGESEVSNKEVLFLAVFFILQAIGITLFIYYISTMLGSGHHTEQIDDGWYDDEMEPVHEESGVFPSSKYRVLETVNPTKRPPVDHERRTDKKDNHTVLCVFQSRSQHLILNGRQYSSSIFPYEYCHIAIYCCLRMDDTVGIFLRQDASFHAFHAMARTNRHVRTTGAIVGEGNRDKVYLQRLFEMSPDGYRARLSFVTTTATWAKANGFERVYVYFPPSLELTGPALTIVAKTLRKQLSSHNIIFGIVSEQKAEGGFALYNVDWMTAELQPGGVLLSPPSYNASHFKGHVLTYYDGRSIGYIQNLTESSPNSPDGVCVLLPGWSFTNHLDKIVYPITRSQASLGQGPQGSVTKKKGHWAYYETCKALDQCRRSSWIYFDSALCNTAWINYPTPVSIQDFICEVQRRTGITCFGLWDSDVDDFADFCGDGPFPLMRAVFEGPLRPCQRKRCQNDFQC